MLIGARRPKKITAMIIGLKIRARTSPKFIQRKLIGRRVSGKNSPKNKKTHAAMIGIKKLKKLDDPKFSIAMVAKKALKSRAK